MRYQKIVFLLGLLLFSLKSLATHIRAGEVIAKRIDNVSLTYSFTFFGYRDVDGVPFGQGRFDFGDGEVFGDDAGETIPWDTSKIVDLGNGGRTMGIHFGPYLPSCK